ncbi:MAG: hypothetical protein WBG88_02630 [Mesorhizobium sp.]
MNAHTKISPTPRADQIVELIRDNIRACSTPSEKAAYTPLDECRYALEEDMSWQACTSPAAAILKLCLIASTASCALSHLTDERLQCLTDDNIAREVGTIIRWIEREFGLSPETIRDYYHTDRTERSAWGKDRSDETSILP